MRVSPNQPAPVNDVFSGHDMKLCHIEYLSFNRLARKETQLFEMIGDEDWVSYFLKNRFNLIFRKHFLRLAAPSIFTYSIGFCLQSVSKDTKTTAVTMQTALISCWMRIKRYGIGVITRHTNWTTNNSF